MIRVAPFPSSKDCATDGGAYASCWVKAGSPTEAVSIAAFNLEQLEWETEEVEETTLIKEGHYDPDSLEHQKVLIAKDLGFACNLHSWPNEASDEPTQ